MCWCFLLRKRLACSGWDLASRLLARLSGLELSMLTWIFNPLVDNIYMCRYYVLRVELRALCFSVIVIGGIPPLVCNIRYNISEMSFGSCRWFGRLYGLWISHTMIYRSNRFHCIDPWPSKYGVKGSKFIYYDEVNKCVYIFCEDWQLNVSKRKGSPMNQLAF